MSRTTPKAPKNPGPTNFTGLRGQFSPLRFLIVIIGGIFLAEVIAMLFLLNFRTLPYYLQTLIDAGIMIVLVSPVIYFFSLSPLLLHIEKRKQVEAQLREMALFATLNPDAVLQVDATGWIIKANPAAEQIGLSIGAQLFEFIPDLRALNLPGCIAAGATLVVFEARLGERVLQWRVYGATELGSAFLYSQDITERKRGEETIKLLSSIVEQTADTVVVTDPKGIIEYVNTAVEKVTGYPKEEILGKNPRVFKAGIHTNQFYGELWDTILKGDVFHGEITNRKKNGDLLHEAKTITPLRDAHGNITHFVATGKDITERKEAEEQLRKAYDEVEVRVQKRTEELSTANNELQAARLDALQLMEEALNSQKELEKVNVLLRESEQRLNRAQEIAHLGSWELDLMNNRLTWSDEVYRIFGLQAQQFEATYGAFLEAVHPDDRCIVDETYSSSLQDGRDAYEIEHRIVRESSREVRTVHEKCDHFRNEAGQIVRSVGMVHDITERKRADDALRRAHDELELRIQERTKELSDEIAERKEIERQLRIETTALESAANGVIITDVAGTILWANPAFLTMSGYNMDEVIGATPQILSSGRHEKVYYLDLWRTILGGNIWRGETINRRKDGSLYVEEQTITPVRLESGELSHFIAIKQDVTERKHAEDALRASEEKFRTLVDWTYDWEIWLDPRGNIIYNSPSCERITGYEPGEFIAMPDLMTRIVHLEDRSLYDTHQKLFHDESAGIEKVEYRIIARNGTERWVEHICRPLFGMDNRYLGRRISNRDISEQKQAEENIRERNQKEKMLIQTIHTMQLDIARDLHDTIGQNIGYLRMKLDHMVEKDLSAKADVLKAEFSQMSQVANESYDLVRGTLAILQSQGPDDLLQLFKRYAGQIVERSAIKVEFTELGKAEFVTIHQMRQLFYIFREALSNIEKHSGASHAWVDMTWEANMVELSIRDDGKGFDPCQNMTGHYGLKFMRDRIEMMKGSYQLKTEPGIGTHIIIGVPLQKNGSEN